MESSLSIESMSMDNAKNSEETLQSLDGPFELDEEASSSKRPPRSTKPTINLEERIRCVTIECVENAISKQMEEVFSRLEELDINCENNFDRNTRRLKNMWRHHKQAVEVLDKLAAAKPDLQSKLETENDELRVEINHLRGVLQQSTDKLDELADRVRAANVEPGTAAVAVDKSKDDTLRKKE